MPTAYEGAPRSQAPAAALDRWWLLFNDPVLDALEDEAFGASPDIRLMAARVLEARATRSAQIAQTLPSGSVTAQASHEPLYTIGGGGVGLGRTNTSVTDSLTGAFNVAWEVDLFGRLKAQRRLARAADAEAIFNIEGTRAALAADVADTYFRMRGLAIQLEDARATARIDNELLEVSRRRATAGAGTADEVDRVASQAGQAEAQAADLQAQLEDARRQLLILVGRDLRALDALDLNVPPPAVPAPPAVVPAELLGRRPDVREAEFRLRAELERATLAHRAVFPTITLLPALGLSRVASPGVSFTPPSSFTSQQVTTTTGFWSMAVGLTVPTLDIPRLLDQARAQDARARQAAVSYEKTVRTAYGEAQNALADLASGEAASTRLDEAEAQARRAWEASRRRYGEGLDNLTATLTTEQSWRQIRSALTTERVDTLRRAVRTYKALGGGWNASGQVVG